MNRRRILTASLLVTLLALCTLAIVRSQDIFDYIALRGYEPPARVVQLADATTMNSSTRRVFYANRPELDDKPAFKNRCRTAEQSIVLGCYVSHKGIFLLDVTDPRLNGVVEVTAAHETLHAAYDRLSSPERKRIDGLTADFFSAFQDKRIRETIEQYRTRDPSVVPGELHSILGTEVQDLSPELEQYYSRYFNDRKKIVAFSQQYEQTFISLKNQVTGYDTQLAQLKKQIDTNEAQINSLDSDLETQRDKLNELLANRQTEEYNAAVPGFNALVGQYNALVSKTRGLIAEFNRVVEKRNAAATTEQELIQTLNSNFTAQPAQ